MEIDEALLGNLLIVAGLSENQIEVIRLWLTGSIYEDDAHPKGILTLGLGRGGHKHGAR